MMCSALRAGALGLVCQPTRHPLPGLQATSQAYVVERMPVCSQLHVSENAFRNPSLAGAAGGYTLVTCQRLRFPVQLVHGEGPMGRIFGFLSVVIVMGIGMYIYSRQATSSSAAAGANTPQAAVNITGVKSDLTS